MGTRDDLNRDAARPTDATELSVEAMEAGPSGVVEREVTIRETDRKSQRPSRANADEGLEQRVDSTTEKVLHRAGDALRSAAPAVGRGAEMAVNATGSALSAASGPLGTIVGKIAGRLGGWWHSAAEAAAELPEEEQQACLIHFEAYTARPAGMTYERALPGYTLGYIAARNPDYRGRGFEEIEPDLRHGFGEERAAEYDALRDFTRYGYQRGINRL
jgi:hypothetical protein